MITRAEMFRQWRSGVFPALAFIGVGLTALAMYGTASQLPTADPATLADQQAQTLHLLGLGFGVSLFSTLFGALSVTRDFGNRSIGRSKLLAGGSAELVGARALAILVQMLIFALVGIGGAVAATWLSLRSVGITAAWSRDATTTAIGIFAAIVFAGYVGYFVAWQTRQSLLTVIGLIVWTTIVESNVITLVPKVGRFLPGGLIMAITRDPSGPPEILPVAWGYMAYSAWLIVLASLAVVRLRRTDVL